MVDGARHIRGQWLTYAMATKVFHTPLPRVVYVPTDLFSYVGLKCIFICDVSTVLVQAVPKNRSSIGISLTPIH